MKKEKVFIPLVAIFIASLLLLLPVQPVLAIGMNFEEGTNGFQVRRGQTLLYNCTVGSNPLFGTVPLNTSDKAKILISYTWNLDLGFVLGTSWIADIILTNISLYDNWTKTWIDATPINYLLMGAYNSTIPVSMPSPMLMHPAGVYNFLTPINLGQVGTYAQPSFVPMNFTSTNHTLVNTTYGILEYHGGAGVVNYEKTPLAPNIEGNWTVWNGTATANGFKKEMIIDNNGILNVARWYESSGTGWSLVWEMKLISITSAEKDEFPVELLLLLMMAGGEGLGIEIIIGIVAAVAIVVVVVVIIAVKKR